MILSLRGGFGHISTSKALLDRLQSDYDVNVVFLFEDVLNNIDFIATVTRNRFSFPKLYNFIIQRRLSFIMRALYWVGNLFFSVFWSRIATSLHTFFQKQNPDCIISVVPLVNSEIASYTKQADIPFILIPTDIDAHFFLKDLKTKMYNKIRICPMVLNDFVKNQLQKYAIDTYFVHHIGAILRSDFFEYKDVAAIKKRYALPEDNPIIMVMMGGVGSRKMIPVAQTLARLSFPVHVVLCVGKDKSVIEQLKNICWNAPVSYTIVGFTEHISDYMAASDLLFTKSGTLSVFEALYMRKILLLDAIGSVLPWEQYNHTFIQESGFGYSVKSYAQLKHILCCLLQNTAELDRIQKNLNQFNRKNGTEEIEILLRRLLG